VVATLAKSNLFRASCLTAVAEPRGEKFLVTVGKPIGTASAKHLHLGGHTQHRSSWVIR